MSESHQLRPGVSVVVPAFRSAATLPAVAERVAAALEGAEVPYELVFVDDGSGDDTWEEIRRLAATGPVRGLRLARNSGQQNALLAGVRTARHEWAVTIDDDLQYRPESIPGLLGQLGDGSADLVYGVAERPRHGWSRGLATRVAKQLMKWITGNDAVTRISAMRAFRTSLRSGFADFDGPYVSLDALLLWSTDRASEVPVPHDPRRHGKSGYSLPALVRHALTLVVGFSARPLRLASALGFLATALGIVLFGYVVIRYAIEGGSVPGFPFLASAISIFSGVQLFAVGLIGEYLARMYPRVMGQPTYAIADEVGNPSP